MNEYEQEIITQLNDSAAKAVKGSEYGIDEHVFGIAAQIIEEKDKLIKAAKVQAKELTHRLMCGYDLEPVDVYRLYDALGLDRSE